MKTIPQSILDAGYRSMVHVEGWNLAARFFHVATLNGEHTIKTQKPPVKIHKTRNRLLYTRANQP